MNIGLCSDWIRYNCIAELKQEADKGYLGFLWWILDPVFYLAVFYLVFGVAFKRGGEGYLHHLLCGLVFWRWFEMSVRQAMQSIVARKSLLTQVYMPKWLLPLSAISNNFVKFGIVLLVFLIFLCLSSYFPNIYWFAIIPLLLVQLILISGIGFLLASIAPILPDISMVFNYFLTGLFFASGIFFSVSDMDAAVKQYFMLNPVLLILEAWRDVLLRSAWPDIPSMLYVVITSLVCVLVGLLILRSHDRSYPRYIR